MLDNDDSITVTVSAYAIICWPVVNCIIKVFYLCFKRYNLLLISWSFCIEYGLRTTISNCRPSPTITYSLSKIFMNMIISAIMPNIASCSNFQIYNNVNSIFTRNHICIRLHNRCEFYSSKSVKISSFCCSEMPSSRIISIKNSFCFDWRLACHHQVGPKKHWMRLLIISFYVHYMALNLLFSQEHFVKRFIF